MAKAKKQEAPAPAGNAVQHLAQWLRSPSGRHGLIIGGALAVFIGLAVAGWKRWGPTIVASPAYVLSEEQIEVTPQPPYIHGNVKAEAIRAGGLAGASILDPKLTEKVQHAFAVHTWVASVKRVTKHHPARVVVELEYRRPAAMVEVMQGNQSGLLPVDAYGVLLPPEDFSMNQVRHYLRIVVGGTPPEGPVGTPWGDARVEAAASIAVALEPCWQKLQLYRVALATSAAGEVTSTPSFDLLTRDGRKIIWGHAPGQEASGEASASEKLAQLADFYEQHGPLPSSDIRELNVRDGKLHATPVVPAKLRRTKP